MDMSMNSPFCGNQSYTTPNDRLCVSLKRMTSGRPPFPQNANGCKCWPSLKVNHEGHEVTRRKLMPRTAFLILRALRGSGFFLFMPQTESATLLQRVRHSPFIISDSAHRDS